MRQAARRDGDFDAIDEMNTLRPLLTFAMIHTCILASNHMLL
jgi:hypothetical protein